MFVHGYPDDRLCFLLQVVGLAIEILGNADTRLLEELPLSDPHRRTVQLASDTTASYRFKVRYRRKAGTSFLGLIGDRASQGVLGVNDEISDALRRFKGFGVLNQDAVLRRAADPDP